MKWWRKETRNNNGVFYGIYSIERPEDWGNHKNNFSKSPPSKNAQDSLVECDYNHDTDSFDDEPISVQTNEIRHAAIQSFHNTKSAHEKIDDIFNGKTTVATLRAACIKAFKLIAVYILK